MINYLSFSHALALIHLGDCGDSQIQSLFKVFQNELIFLHDDLSFLVPDFAVNLGIIIRSKYADEFMKPLEERLNISGSECHKYLALRRLKHGCQLISC